MIGAIDIGGTKTMAALVEEDGRIVDQVRFATALGSWEEHFALCVREFQALCKKHGLEAGKLAGIGLSLPGMTDGSNGVLLYAPYSGWRNVPAAAWFAQALGNPRVRAENDVNACALGELTYGHGRELTDFLWITVSTGVGGAIVADSKLIRGAGFVAGEFGHLKVERVRPRKCPCGQLGCLEAHASGTAIGAAFREYLEMHPESVRKLEQSGYRADALGCRKLADAGDKGAKELFRQAAFYLGVGIAQAVNLLNPQAVILGGGVAASLDLMEPVIRQVIRTDVVSQSQKVMRGGREGDLPDIPPNGGEGDLPDIPPNEREGDLPIKYTALGYEAALIGAAALTLADRR